MLSLSQKVGEALAAIRQRTERAVDFGIILGSGLGALAGEVQDVVRIPYHDIPHFPVSTVAGHAGALHIGVLEGKSVAVFQGRIHYYEGYNMEEVTFPVRIMRALGASTMLVTNAVGGIAENLENGDLVAITDHINFMGMNPLRGPNDENLGPRFPDMVRCYEPKLIDLAQAVARENGINLKKGIYTAVSGPSYETRAEIAFFRTIGGATVGMSTVPEVIVARHAGLAVLGISCVTDILYGDYAEVSHDLVLAVANETGPKFIKLMKAIVKKLPLPSNTPEGQHARS